MSRNPTSSPTMSRAVYKKPKRMADAELTALFDRKKNVQKTLKAADEKSAVTQPEPSPAKRKD